jgi:imidazolonepropionase-like amidohydrolase
VASGPPLTSVGGHCHFLGGEVANRDQISTGMRERVQRGVDVVKVMASGGMTTPGSDVMGTQFSADEMHLLVELAHEAGLPITAHAHSLAAVERSVDAGVDCIEHCSCLTEKVSVLSRNLWPALPIGTSLLAVCSPQSANRSQPSSASYPKADRGHRMDSTADARASR